MHDDLVAAWPPYGLALHCGDLELATVTDEHAVALGPIVSGLLNGDEWRFMPHLAGVVAESGDATARNVLREVWRQRASLAVDDWHLPLAVIRNGQVLGMQALESELYLARRDVRTESYLDTGVRRDGVGTRMRAMVVEFAFTYLGALTMSSGYALGNDGSRRVSEKLGYLADGTYIDAHAGVRHVGHRLRLRRERWAAFRPGWLDDLEVTGATALLEMVGITDEVS
jgi:RimJ/RimL family protein N-acetyltransferase